MNISNDSRIGESNTWLLKRPAAKRQTRSFNSKRECNQPLEKVQRPNWTRFPIFSSELQYFLKSRSIEKSQLFN